MSITFGRVPFPVEMCDFTNVTGPLRIQLTRWPRLIVVVFVISGSVRCIHIFPVIYDCRLGSRRYFNHDWFVWGYDPFLMPYWRVSYLAVPFCMWWMWFGVGCGPQIWKVTRWVASFFYLWVVFFGLLFFRLSLLLARFPHPALMPSYWVRCSVWIENWGPIEECCFPPCGGMLNMGCDLFWDGGTLIWVFRLVGSFGPRRLGGICSVPRVDIPGVASRS